MSRSEAAQPSIFWIRPAQEMQRLWPITRADRAALSHRPARVQVRSSWRKILLLVLLCCVALLIPGCSNVKPSLAAISVSDSSGAKVTSLIVATSVDVDVAVNGDPVGLGVDWSLFCGGSAVPGFTKDVCGTITPVHVGSSINMVYLAPIYVPVGNIVTLTATATGDPSRSVSVALTILPQPATIQFAPGFLPPATLGTHQEAQIAAIVTNDPRAQGVKWSVTCGSNSCGLLSLAVTASGSNPTIYSAPATLPAGGTVTITAASVYDSTKSVASTIEIKPLAVAVTATSLAVPFRGTTSLTATVTYDAANAGVKWLDPECGSPGQCGSISPSQSGSGEAVTYQAPESIPSGGTVKVTAKSVTEPSKTASLTLTIEKPPPISVSVTPEKSMVQPGGAISLTANVADDFTNQGVTWQCPPDDCYPLTSTFAPYLTTFSASSTASPSTTPIVVTATSIADPRKSGAAKITIVPPISVTLKTEPITAGVPATFSATVTNDIAPGGVDWVATGCPTSDCGIFVPAHSASGKNVTYKAPNNVPWPATNATVAITATSTASLTIPPLRSATAQVPVTPVTYAYFVPFAPGALPVGNPTLSPPTLISLVGAAANDSTNAGVDWTVTCHDASAAACGQILKTPERVATATARDLPATFWPYSKKVHTASGQAIAYEPPTQMPSDGKVTLTVTSTANPSASSTQTVTITSDLSGPALAGKVLVGSQPVSGASVELFVAGNTGYGSASTPLVISNGGDSVTTASDGSFAIPEGYSCPSLNSLLYLVALGGQPGGPQGPTNPQLGLMTAIGPCSDLPSSSTVSLVVNEVTTVAAAHALAPFIAADYAHIGSSSANYNNGPNPSNATNFNNGLANAFAAVNNLVDITLGTARSITPAGNGTPPQAEINTLADAVNTCTATQGGAPGDGSACDAFFRASNVNPPGGGVSTTENAPTSVLQAVIEVAQVPSTLALTTAVSGTPLYDLVANPSYTPVFSPNLTDCGPPCNIGGPYDWSFAISYTGGGLNGQGLAPSQSSSMAIDASGNVWISNRHTSSVSELNSLGAALSPFGTGITPDEGGGFVGGGLDSPQKIAIDPYGNAWVLNGIGLNNSLSVFDSAGDPIAGSPFSGAGNSADLAGGLAIDGSGNVWVSQAGIPGDVAEYEGYIGALINGKNVKMGASLSPAGVGFVNGMDNPNGAIAIDGSGDVWVLNQGNFSAVPLSVVNGHWLNPGYPDQGDTIDPSSGNPYNPPQYLLGNGTFGNTLAIDSAGNLFIPDSASGSAKLFELLAGGSSANFGGIGQAVTPSTSALFTPVAIDGAGHLWMMVHPNTNTSPEEPMAVAEITSSGAVLNYNGAAQGLALPNISANGPTTIATDASGDVWVLSGFVPNTLIEFVGVSTPVVTPTSVALQRKKLGKAP